MTLRTITNLTSSNQVHTLPNIKHFLKKIFVRKECVLYTTIGFLTCFYFRWSLTISSSYCNIIWLVNIDAFSLCSLLFYIFLKAKFNPQKITAGTQNCRKGDIFICDNQIIIKQPHIWPAYFSFLHCHYMILTDVYTMSCHMLK